MENNLPKGWEVKKLVDHVPILKTGVEKFDGEKSYYSTGSISDNGMIPEGKFTFRNRPARANRLVLEKDVVQARMRETQKAVLVDKNLKESLLSTGFLQFRPEDNSYNSRLFYYYLRSDRFLKQRDEYATGSTQVALTDEGAEKIDLVIPPQEQQKSIADKLDVLLTKVRDVQSRLDKIPTILGRFRQSILAAAFSGELTKEWRKKNKYSSVDSLLKRNEYKIADEIELSDLPDSWVWGALGNYADCSRGRFSIRPRNDPRYYGGKHPFIQIGDLPREGGYINKHSQTLNDLGLGVSKMFPKGTVAIAIVGATIANTGILEYNMCFPDSMVGIETGDEIRNRYCELFLRYKKHDIRQESYSSGGQPNINLQTLNPLPIAFAPKEEQVEIVRRIEHQFHVVAEIESRYLHIKSYTDKLEQSILAKAFRGELVKQEG